MKQWNARLARTLLAAVLVAALFMSSAVASSVYARINAKTKIYEKPSKSARTATVQKNLKVKLEDASNDWGKVSYKGKVAYIPLKYLTLTSPYKAYAASTATVYKRAGSSRVGTIPAGTVVYVVGLTGKYARVKKSKSSATVYYIRSNDLTKNKVYVSSGGSTGTTTTTGTYSSSSGTSTNMPASLRSTTTSPSVSKIEYAIYVAQNLIGAPYKESSHPPTSFDCATFTKWCYGKSKSGAISSSAKSQGYDTRYAIVSSISSLVRGDMVCFDTIADSDLSDHVGIYLGNGYFIHASSVAKMVVVSNLNSGYYNRVFSWGRRIFYD